MLIFDSNCCFSQIYARIQWRLLLLLIRYEQAKEESIVTYFFELFQLSVDYESKTRTNPLTLACYMVLWRLNLEKSGTIKGPAARAETNQALLFELVQFVGERHKPQTQLSHLPDEDETLMKTISSVFEGSDTVETSVMIEDGPLSSSEQNKLKRILQEMNEEKEKIAFEKRKVQV